MSGIAEEFLIGVRAASEKSPPAVVFEPSRITPIMSGAQPSWDIQNEKGYHRLVCYRTAAGDTPKEIAEALGVDKSTVYNILRQPRSKEMIAQLIHENHNDDISAILKGAAAEAIVVQVDLMRTAKDESVRLRSATDILNRAYGTPVKSSEMKSPSVSDDPQREMQELDRQLAALAGGPVIDAESEDETELE